MKYNPLLLKLIVLFASLTLMLSCELNGDGALMTPGDNYPDDNNNLPRKRTIKDYPVVDDDGTNGAPGGPKIPDIDPLDLEFNHDFKLPQPNKGTHSDDSNDLSFHPVFGKKGE